MDSHTYPMCQHMWAFAHTQMCTQNCASGTAQCVSAGVTEGFTGMVEPGLECVCCSAHITDAVPVCTAGFPLVSACWVFRGGLGHLTSLQDRAVGERLAPPRELQGTWPQFGGLTSHCLGEERGGCNGLGVFCSIGGVRPDRCQGCRAEGRMLRGGVDRVYRAL